MAQKKNPHMRLPEGQATLGQLPAEHREIVPALRRAFMRVKPDYFTWSVEAQERYRVSMPDKDGFCIRQEVAQSAFWDSRKNG